MVDNNLINKGIGILNQTKSLPPQRIVYSMLKPLVQAVYVIYDSKSHGGMYSQIEFIITNKVSESITILFNYLNIVCPMIVEFTTIRKSINDIDTHSSISKAYNEYVNYNSLGYYYPDYENMIDSVVLYDLRHVLPKSYDSMLEIPNAVSLYTADLAMPVFHECHHHIATYKMLKSGMSPVDIVLLKEVQSFNNKYESIARDYSVNIAQHLYMKNWSR